MPETSPSRTIGNRYELTAHLGSGGMGEVWRGRDTLLERDVAVKEVLLPRGLGPDTSQQVMGRARREARAAARLNHPSAVRVYDVVEDELRAYVVMELVEAETLSQRIEREGPLSPQETAKIGVEVLGALEAAHAVGILHRDVKPSNILLEDSGRVVLTDFGIARDLHDATSTTTGLLLGSAAYIAPERLRGEETGPASDLWSLGASLYTAVEGRVPHQRESDMATVAAIASSERATFTRAGALEETLTGLLDPDPATRLEAQAAHAALEGVAAGRTVRGAGGSGGTQVLPVPTSPTRVSPRAESAPPGVGRVRAASETGVVAVVAPVRAPEHSPGSHPAPPRRQRGLRRRGGVLVGAGALGVATLLGTALLGGERGERLAGGDPKPGVSAAAGAPRSEGAPSAAPSAVPGRGAAEEGAVAAEAPSAPREGAAEGAGGRGSGLPAGWEIRTGADWQVAVPGTWTEGARKGSTEYRGDGRTLRIDTGRGQRDAVADREAQASAFAKRYPSYEEIGIRPVRYLGEDGAEWEFTYEAGGASLHVINRVVAVEGRGYSLYYQVRASDDIEDARSQFERIAQSFEVGGE